jgi:hypothetical protein
MESAARATLARLGQLPPLPEGVDARQRIKLQLLIDDHSNVDEFERKVGAMAANAEAANRRLSDRLARMAGRFAQTP